MRTEQGVRVQFDNKQGTPVTEQIESLQISEIFGPTIQGEGALIGSPTVFVRTGGCDYRCSWCDTGYAVLPDYEAEWQKLSVDHVFSKILELTKSVPYWITLSGGNPALQPLEGLIRKGHAQGYKFSMETQGSVAKPWFALLDQLTISPKPPSSGMHFKLRGLERVLDAAQYKPDISFKFVVADMDDLQWAHAIAQRYPHIDAFVQPCNTRSSLYETGKGVELADDSMDYLRERMLWLIEAIQLLGWHDARVLPQFHVWLWGSKAGV